MQKLEFNKTYSTKYVIPLWLRDEQIKLALKRNLKRIDGAAPHDRKIAVVGYGPSLKDTWEELKNFDTIMSCSGAHKFLLERGIIPKYHVAVDPLPKNTVQLIGQPHKDVEYLISSTCHPDVFDHLEGYNVTLWHVFSNEKEAYKILPRGEWAITGGCDVGMRTLTISRFFGYRNIHIFGIDGSYPEGGARHADAHPVPQKGAPVDFQGKTFFTTPAMLESAKMVFHELDMLVDVEPTFYGEGLVQEMAKTYKRTIHVGKTATIAFKPELLITEEYKKLNVKLHETNLAFGVGGGKYGPTVEEIVGKMKASSVLDYGCGKGYLAKALPFPIWEYDPAIPGKDELPRPADLVCCFDVLEHVERELLGPVLDDLRRVTKKVGYFVIHTGASSKTLEDGRNAHLIQAPVEWWKNELAKFFNIAKIIVQPPLIHVLVSPGRSKKKSKILVSSVPVIEEVVMV